MTDSKLFDLLDLNLPALQDVQDAVSWGDLDAASSPGLSEK